MNDPTEDIRAILAHVINATADPVVDPREPTWTTDELQRDFDVEGFMAPFVIVRHKLDNVRGTLMFRHSPRIYFNFVPDRQ